MITPAHYSGVVRGNSIELDDSAGLEEGQRVTISLQSSDQAPEAEGLRRSFGAWAEDAAELDEFLAWSRERRKIGRTGPDA